MTFYEYDGALSRTTRDVLCCKIINLMYTFNFKITRVCI